MPAPDHDNRPQFSHRARTALEIVTEAATLAQEWFDRGVTDIEFKGDGSPVTHADRSVEQFLRHRLEQAFPEDGILGEEFEERPGSSGGRWIVDPIDGTKSFIRGVPLYATLLAYQTAGDITFGAIVLPSLGQSVFAERGAGCWSNDGQAGVSHLAELDGAHIMATWLEDWDLAVLERARSQRAIVRTWGDAYGYFLVATGRADAMVDFSAKLYDLAAPSIIVQEAGGRFTGLTPSSSSLDAGGIASNGLIHDQVVGLAQR